MVQPMDEKPTGQVIEIDEARLHLQMMFPARRFRR
jgi:hypothetical protein